ncbi:MAG: hypothetical protein ISS33_06370 [Candidatus Omnitrophica bacterium]|nr:hypothetical protein [Candidatus Omnitrophota bacterium]
MTEHEFWNFLKENKNSEKIPQISGYRDISDPEMRAIGKYFEAHSLLPKNYEKLSFGKLVDMSQLLFVKNVSTVTKEAILVILAHQNSKEILEILKDYAKNPDKGLEMFSNFALGECETWTI